MWMAVHELLRPKWTDRIHEEWMRNVLLNHKDLSKKDVQRIRQLMDAHAGDCLVGEYEHRMEGITLPDSNDVHVLAAAIEAEAEAIVTWNVTDFPSKVVGKYGIDVLTPDQFVAGLLGSQPVGVTLAMREHRLSLKNPTKTDEEYLATLGRQGLSSSLLILKDYISRSTEPDSGLRD
jgi:predicted nucleic acid-binding protein